MKRFLIPFAPTAFRELDDVVIILFRNDLIQEYEKLFQIFQLTVVLLVKVGELGFVLLRDGILEFVKCIFRGTVTQWPPLHRMKSDKPRVMDGSPTDFTVLRLCMSSLRVRILSSSI